MILSGDYIYIFQFTMQSCQNFADVLAEASSRNIPFYIHTYLLSLSYKYFYIFCDKAKRKGWYSLSQVTDFTVFTSQKHFCRNIFSGKCELIECQHYLNAPPLSRNALRNHSSSSLFTSKINGLMRADQSDILTWQEFILNILGFISRCGFAVAVVRESRGRGPCQVPR